MISCSADEIPSFVPLSCVLFAEYPRLRLSIPCYLHGQGGRGDNALADGASLFEEAYAEDDARSLLEECQILRLIVLCNV